MARSLHHRPIPDALEETPVPDIHSILHGPGRPSRVNWTAWKPPPSWRDRHSNAPDPFRGRAVYPSLRPGMILRELEGFLVIHDPVSRDIHRLNLPAATILLLANGKRGLVEIAVEYACRLGPVLWKALADVEAVVATLVRRKVLIPRRERIDP